MTLTRTHYALFAFVGWSFLTVVFGAGPRPDAAFWFAARMAVTALVFVLVAAAVQTGRIGLRTVVAVLVLSVLAHAAFAGIEFLNQGPFGLTRLGESGRYSAVSITIGPLQLAGGSYLAGFMGSSIALYSLSVLCIPVLLLYALFSSARAAVRWAAGIGAVYLSVIVRLTFRDAGRGAMLLVLVAAIGAIAFLLVQHGRAIHASLADLRRRFVGTAIVVLASALALLYPGSVSGDAVEMSTSTKNPPSGTDTNTGGSGETSAATGGGGGTRGSPTLADRLDGIQIPLFDISTLGGRARQYLATIDVTLTHPLFGLGGSNFPYIAAQYGLSGATAPGVDTGKAVHNAYLAVLVGTGVPGFVFFIVTLVGVVWSCLTLVRHETVERWLALGLCCGLFGYYAALFWDLQWATVAGWMPFWMLAGGIVGAARHQRTPSPS